jgi:hypothetical protein
LQIKRVYGDPDKEPTPYIYDFLSEKQRRMEVDFNAAASNPTMSESHDADAGESEAG